jgi:hypothetical protein
MSNGIRHIKKEQTVTSNGEAIAMAGGFTCRRLLEKLNAAET